MSINYLAVLVSAVVIFVLGGLWFSLLFAKPWLRMMGVTDPQGSPGAALLVQFFVCALLTSWGMAMILSHAGTDGGRARDRLWHPVLARVSPARPAMRRRKRGRSRSRYGRSRPGYSLVSFIIAAVILSAWH